MPCRPCRRRCAADPDGYTRLPEDGADRSEAAPTAWIPPSSRLQRGLVSVRHSAISSACACHSAGRPFAPRRSVWLPRQHDRYSIPAADSGIAAGPSGQAGAWADRQKDLRGHPSPWRNDEMEESTHSGADDIQGRLKPAVMAHQDGRLHLAGLMLFSQLMAPWRRGRRLALGRRLSPGPGTWVCPATSQLRGTAGAPAPAGLALSFIQDAASGDFCHNHHLLWRSCLPVRFRRRVSTALPRTHRHPFSSHRCCSASYCWGNSSGGQPRSLPHTCGAWCSGPGNLHRVSSRTPGRSRALSATLPAQHSRGRRFKFDMI